MAEIIRGGLISVDKGQVEATDVVRHDVPGAPLARHHPAGDALDRAADRQPAHQHDQGATSLVSVIAMADLALLGAEHA